MACVDLPNKYFFLHSTDDATSTEDGHASSIFGEENFTNISSCAGQDCHDNCGHSSTSDNMDPFDRARAEKHWREAERFVPTRSKDPEPGWEDTYGISLSELRSQRKVALEKLESIREDCPDLHFYLSELIKIVHPGDNLFFLLLHCAVQLSRGGMSANCGCKHALGPNVDIASLGNCSLDGMNGLSDAFFKELSSINMGYYAGGLGGINGYQEICSTQTKAFSPCAALDDNCRLPDTTLEGLIIAIGHFEAVKANTLMISTAGTTTNVNKRILFPLAHTYENSECVSIIKDVEMNHQQFFRRGMIGKTLLESCIQMSQNFRRLSECVSSHLERCGIVVPEGGSLFDRGCASEALPMIQNVDGDDSVTDETLLALIKLSKQARTNEILAFCRRNRMSPVSGSAAAL